MCAPDSSGKSRHGLLLATVVVLLGSFIAVLAPAASAAGPEDRDRAVRTEPGLGQA